MSSVTVLMIFIEYVTSLYYLIAFLKHVQCHYTFKCYSIIEIEVTDQARAQILYWEMMILLVLTVQLYAILCDKRDMDRVVQEEIL